MGASRPSRRGDALGAAFAVAASLFGACVLGLAAASGADAATESPALRSLHEGVASCSGSTCHSRQVDTTGNVRQNEIITWKDPGRAGAHSRAWRALGDARGQAILRKLGGNPQELIRTKCAGCHTDPGPADPKGQLNVADGVGCEACHGGSSEWLASHRAVEGTHANNVARGMRALDSPKVRAEVCLDCHFGSARPAQFVGHDIMAAGHPRVSFELDLFSSLTQHWTVDRDYVTERRKRYAGGVTTWAVGQALAVDRALSLFAQPRGQGVFPEFYFFDCQSCHRQISDERSFRPAWEANPGRPIPSGQPPFNDENMIMLSAAAKVAAPELAARFEADSTAFHTALARDRGAAPAAAQKLAATARALAERFDSRPLSKSQKLAMLDAVLGADVARRLTDYEGSAQAVMAADTLLNGLVNSGDVDRGAAARVRPALDEAYARVRDPNTYRPAEFREALGKVAQAARSLK
jgi:hypothetical protein